MISFNKSSSAALHPQLCSKGCGTYRSEHSASSCPGCGAPGVAPRQPKEHAAVTQFETK